MSQGSMSFWERHSVRFLEMALQADRRETLVSPDGYGKHTRECGDTVEIFLIMRNGKIESVSFETNGCLYSAACANAVAHLAEGKNLEEAKSVTPETVVEFLETLPEDEDHCALLAVTALRHALEDAERKQGSAERT
jgi:nitrogen fixation protein NifU and related proteins